MRKALLTISFVLLTGAALLTSAEAQVPVLTYHYDSFRSGWNHNETILTQALVKSSTFGKLFIMPADGLVDAEPLYAPKLTINGSTHNVVFVATENDTVYAYDADTAGAPLWQVTMLKSGETPSDNRGCGQVTP